MKKTEVDKIKKLIDEIIGSVENNSTKLSVALKKCKRIFKRIKNQEFEDFVNREIEGNFTDDNIPDYRTKNAEPIGVFQNRFNGITNHVPLNYTSLIDQANLDPDTIYKRPLPFSIPEIEDYLDKTELKELMIGYTQGQLDLIKPFLETDANNGWDIKTAYFKFSYSTFSQIIAVTQNQLIEYLLKIEKDLNRYEELENENFFEDGEHFSAIIKLNDILKNAKREIILIDGYTDEKTLQFFSIKKPHIKIKILTSKKSNNERFKLFIDAFNSEHQNLEVKSSNSFHDRFVIIDQELFFHIGASIKDAGKKAFMFTRIEESFMQNAVMDKFKKEWD